MKKTAKRKSVIKKVRKSKFPFLPFVFVLIAITGVIVYLVINNNPAKTPKAATPLNTVDLVIATRGNNLLPHDINLPSPMVDWAWGRHATESTKFKQPSSGSVAPWLVMYRDATTINTPNNARLNVRRIALWNYQPSNSQWVKLYDGLPQWMVNINLDFSGGFEDLTPKIEADGSYSFAIPTSKVIHMAAGPWPSIFEGNGILAVVEARLLGSAADIAAAKAGMDAGADYRQAGGAFSGYDTPGYYESGFGHFGLLTGEWKAYDMLSSNLTDSQFRANHPAGLDTAPIASPTPTPPQATTQPILPTPTPTPSTSTVSLVVGGSPASSPYSVVANTNAPGDIRVEFKVDGSPYHTENDGPYSLFGDTNSVLNTGKLGTGQHIIIANVYPQTGSSLVATGSTTVTEGTPDTDTDRDGFSDKVEVYMGTNPNLVCGVNAWPPDVDGDKTVTILDMTNVANSYNTKTGDAKYNKRYDMDASGTITILDLTIVSNYFLQKCATPVVVPLASRPDVNQFIAATSKVIEAETFKLNSGYADPAKNIFSDSSASGSKGFILWSTGSAQAVTSNGFGKVTLRVKADVCDGGPKLTLKIDGKSLYSQSFSSTGWTDVTVDFAAAAGTNHTIRVELASDRYRAGVCDRNLRFDKVTLL